MIGLYVDPPFAVPILYASCNWYAFSLRGYNGLKIGVVYDEGVINSPFAENFDICVDYIVTEKRIIKVEKKNVWRSHCYGGK